MKKKLLKSLIGISVMSVMALGTTAVAEEYYYDDTYYYEEGSDDYYDGSDYDYDGSDYYYDGSDEYYDGSDYNDEYYDDSYQEEYYEEQAAEPTPKAEQPKEEVTSGDFAHQDAVSGVKRGNNKKREKANADGMVHSYLTGKLIAKDTAFSRPVAVMINNIIDALPQDGISNASVIYECPVEGEITRMMAIFEDLSDIGKIGPVRSCRDYYIDFALEFDAIYVHFGQAVYACDLLNTDMVNNISGLEFQEGYGSILGYAGEDVFFRTDDRPAPHNCYTSADGIRRGIERKDYNMGLDNSYKGHFKFAADGEEVTYDGGKATHIVPHLYSNHPDFTYNADNQKYYRNEYGSAQIDQTYGTQLAVDNLIIQYCPIRPYDDHGYLDIDTNAGGEAILFTRGTYTKATWVKATDWGPAKYYDKDGEEIAINQGTTWVCVVQDTRSGDTSFE